MHPPIFDGCFLAHKIGSRHLVLKNDSFLMEITIDITVFQKGISFLPILLNYRKVSFHIIGGKG